MTANQTQISQERGLAMFDHAPLSDEAQAAAEKVCAILKACTAELFGVLSSAEGVRQTFNLMLAVRNNALDGIRAHDAAVRAAVIPNVL